MLGDMDLLPGSLARSSPAFDPERLAAHLELRHDADDAHGVHLHSWRTAILQVHLAKRPDVQSHRGAASATLSGGVLQY
jgi:hypothetical protein